MLESSVNRLKQLAESAKSEPSTLEFGERLSAFLQNESAVYSDGLSFPIWCIKNSKTKVVDLLFASGFDFAGYVITDKVILNDTSIDRYGNVTLSKVAARYSEKSFTKHFNSELYKQRRNIALLQDACRCGDLDMVVELIKEGTPVDGSTRELTTPLMVACQFGHYGVIQYLLKAGADVNAEDFMGATPLMWASYSDSVEILKILVKYGADVNAKDKLNGSTPLIWWATNSKDNVSGAKYLVENGAKTSSIIEQNEKKFNHRILSGSGVSGVDWTAKDHAKTSGNAKIAEYLAEVRKKYRQSLGI